MAHERESVRSAEWFGLGSDIEFAEQMENSLLDVVADRSHGGHVLACGVIERPLPAPIPD